MKILLIDDSLLVRNTVKRMLKAISQSVIILEAKDGKNGMDVFYSERPDMVMVDLLMPGIDGETVVRQIKSGSHPCFVVVVTSNIQKPVRERLLGFGADMFMDKPITFEKVKMIMEEFSKRKG